MTSASNCYDYYSRAACVGNPCSYGGSSKCYWAREYKRSVEQQQQQQQQQLPEEDAAELEEADTNEVDLRNKRLAILRGSPSGTIVQPELLLLGTDWWSIISFSCVGNTIHKW